VETDLEDALGYRRKAKQLEAKLADALSKLAELQATADPALRDHSEGTESG